jgi:hypothetical protein
VVTIVVTVVVLVVVAVILAVPMMTAAMAPHRAHAMSQWFAIGQWSW